ncbi:hypothetical protein [Janthinobacterium sp. 17J80-10]|uniref:hypothetical protein n=1 Tax=Janthinobacterium sp. 17J80-10 TaxID=2497863 RepID=UPI0010057A64|nr:hypothetical protein [Janthinobacterium sp. 17J80-10]QAU33260.1 hypothetical protein EKL02_03150 [Janthinobacterium sp. 17J80-10]
MFHDGVIASHLASKDGLLLIVEIKYLAQRINPAYTKFLLCLFDARDIQFHTWPNNADNPAKFISAIDEIFQPHLAILQGEVRNQKIEVVCNQASPNFPYCGGELEFHAESATVSDESGRFWRLEDLEELSKAYWDEWSNPTG